MQFIARPCQMLTLVEFLAECMVLRGKVVDPGARFVRLAVALDVGGGGWFGGA